MTPLQAIPVLLEVIDVAQVLGARIKAASDEGRDLTPDEWAEIDAQRKAAWTRLDAAIVEGGGAPPPAPAR
jgi:hypothetical protein